MNILITEDDRHTAIAVMQYFEHIGHQAIWAPTGERALELVDQQNFDCLLLDIGLPGISGNKVLVKVRQNHPQLPIIILSAASDPDDRVSGLNMGADDYVPKPFSLQEIQARILAIKRRNSGHLGSIIKFDRLLLDRNFYSASLDGKELLLSKREFEILEILTTRATKVVRKEYISESLSTLDSYLSMNSIEVYIHKIRKILNQGKIQIRTIRGVGYMLEKEEMWSKT